MTIEMTIDTEKIRTGDVIELGLGIRLVAIALDAQTVRPPAGIQEHSGRMPRLREPEPAAQYPCDRCGAVSYGIRRYGDMRCPCGNIVQAR